MKPKKAFFVQCSIILQTIKVLKGKEDGINYSVISYILPAVQYISLSKIVQIKLQDLWEKDINEWNASW